MDQTSKPSVIDFAVFMKTKKMFGLPLKFKKQF
jgi:hypothetical protein